MQLSNMVGLYNNAQSTGEITSQVGVQKLVSTLSDMKAGNIFEGTVNYVKNGQVTLGLSNGQSISARLDQSVSLSQGQSMFFQVKSNDGSTIAIRPFTVEGNQVNLTLVNALGAAGLSVNSTNLNMVNAMMENSMPIDRDSLTQMARLVANNPTANADTLVSMQKLGLPTTPEMISQFENYKNDAQAITAEMDSFMEELPNALADDNLSGQQLAKMAGDVLSILTENLDTAEQVLPDSALTQMDPQGEIAPDAAGGQNAEAGGLQTGPEGQTGTETIGGNPLQGTLSANPEQTLQTPVAAQTPENAPAQGSLPSQDGALELPQDAPTAATGEAAENAMSQESTSQMASAQPGSLGALFNSNQLSVLTDNLFQASLLPDNQTLQPDQNAMQLLSDIASYLPNMSNADKDSLMKLFTSVEFKDLTKEAMQQQWTLKPEQLSGADSQKISRLYENLKDQLDRIENAVRATGHESQSLSDTAQTIRNNVDFMNQVNQTVSYVQIPLQMNGKNASGELYVYRNKKEISDPDGELSAFLHLDMENLGSTDVSVKLKNKNVDTKFYFDNDESFRLVTEHTGELESRLKAKGYNCNISVVNEEKHVNLVDDFLTAEKHASAVPVHRYSFDMRA